MKHKVVDYNIGDNEVSLFYYDSDGDYKSRVIYYGCYTRHMEKILVSYFRESMGFTNKNIHLSL